MLKVKRRESTTHALPRVKGYRPRRLNLVGAEQLPVEHAPLAQLPVVHVPVVQVPLVQVLVVGCSVGVGGAVGWVASALGQLAHAQAYA